MKASQKTIKHSGVSKFKRDLRVLCKKHNISLKLIYKPNISIESNITVSGYFSSDDKELVVATKKDVVDWLEILIHESCHLDQFIEDAEVWANSALYNGMDTGILYDLWLAGIIELKPKILNEITQLIIDLERDCDKRAVEKIKKYGLSDIIDIDTYIKKSNAYHLFYDAVSKLRRWNNPNKSPYKYEEIYNKFPRYFLKTYKLSKTQFKYIKGICFK